MSYLTVMSPVRRHKKLFSYYLIIWRNSTLSSQDDPDRNPTLIVTGRDSMRFYEIPRDSTSIVKGRSCDKDDPATRTILTIRTILTMNSISIPICLSVKWLHRRWVRRIWLYLIRQKTGSNGFGNYKPSRINEFGPMLTQIMQHLNEVYYKNYPI